MSGYGNPDCHFGDHNWRGGACSSCGERFRCGCGRFVTIEGIQAHLDKACPIIQKLDTREATR